MPFIPKLTGPGLFRLLLATLIFFHHITRYSVGGAAVYIFFGLSGYWIYKMWTFKYSRTVNPYVTYLISRVWRLIPTFLLINLITIVAECALGESFQSLRGTSSWMHFLVSQVFILGYDTLTHQPMVPAWSLDFEMQFYVVAPLLILVVTSLARPGLLLGIAGMLSLASAVWVGSSALTSYLVFFLIGIVAAERNWQPSGKLAGTFCGIGLALFVGCLLSPIRGVLVAGAHPGALAKFNPHANVILALLAIPYAIYTTRQTGFERDGMFADLSYIVYLLHWAGAKSLFLYKNLGMSRIVFTSVIWVAVYALAVVIWRFYDRPINDSRSKWVKGRKLSVERSLRPVEVDAAAT
jgi:peptidoglycan/LPS O-acetylase OafA/YrhL